MFIHTEYYQFATLNGFKIRKGFRRIFIHTKHYEIVIGW